MKNNKTIIVSLLFLICSCTNSDFDEYMDNINKAYDYAPMFSSQNNYIADLYLVYQGTFHPFEYTEEQFEPYVYTNIENGLDWLYDGFLFLELETPNGRKFGSTATKEDWKWLINRHYGDNVGVTALNGVLQKLRQQNQVPLRKRKVVISIPAPDSTPINWGEIDGRTLDMSLDTDRLQSVYWFIDEVLQGWKEKDYNELEFAGFYWLHEGESNYTGDGAILPAIAEYIKSKGLHFYWIPYFGAPMGPGDWKQWGFDIAYQQPNYFFFDNSEKSPHRMNDACQFGSKYNMGMEFECNRNVVDTIYQRRFTEYIDFFDKHNVLQNAPIAYYDDRGTLYEMSKSADPSLINLYKKLCVTIIERQKRCDELYNRIK